MATTHDGPAFPTPQFYDEKPIGCEPGMALRDWFAGQALAGIMAGGGSVPDPEPGSFEDYNARHAYRLADAMLAARERQ